MNLFDALNYSGEENKNSVLLMSILAHLSEPASDSFLSKLLPENLGRADEIQAQRSFPSVGVFDGWMRWSGRCVLVLEAKVGQPLGVEQPDRYLRWLGQQTEPVKILWLLTADREEFTAIAGRLTVPDGVLLRCSTWGDVARWAEEISPPETAERTDHLLLNALSAHLRKRGLATPQTPPLHPLALGLAVGTLPQIRHLRAHVLDWLRSLRWIHRHWGKKVRLDSWREVSICAESYLQLSTPGNKGRPLGIVWWIEIFGPAERGTYGDVWPPGQRLGLGLRVGFLFKGAEVSEGILEPLRAVMGMPSAAGRPDYEAPPQGTLAYTYDSNHYHEVWWMVPFDPMDLSATERRLRAAMAEQGRRVARFVQGGAVSTIAPIIAEPG